MVDTLVVADEAAQIMGSNFLGVNHVEEHFGRRLDNAQRKLFETVPCSPEELEANKGCQLVAYDGTSIMATHSAANQLFYSKTNPWYGDDRQVFARQIDPSEVGWWLIDSDIVPGSTFKSWDEQKTMAEAPFIVPKARLLTYAANLKALVTGERLYTRYWARTDDVSAHDYRVDVGFDSDGWDVNGWDDEPDSNIGVVRARKLG